MKKAIKNLIRDRKLENFQHKVVDVEHIGGRPISLCHDNAADEMELHRNADGTCPVKVTAGWLVGDWNGLLSPVIPHYWNYDQRTQKHYDTTDSGYFRGSLTGGVTYLWDDAVHTMNWGDAKGFCYYSDNKPYMIGKNGNQVLVYDFSNATVEELVEVLQKAA